jgi:serine/threonine-protein kinase
VNNPNVLPALEQVCMRALRKRCEERFASAREMRAALRAAVGVSDDPSASLFVPEHRASIPGMDTQPAFSSRVPPSRRAGTDVPTLQFSEPPRGPARGVSARAFRYVLGATLVALAVLAIVVGRGEMSASTAVGYRRDGVAVVESPVAPAPVAAAAIPGEPTTVVDEKSASVTSLSKAGSRRLSASRREVTPALVAATEHAPSSVPAPPALSESSAPEASPERAKASAEQRTPIPVESAVVPVSPARPAPAPLDPSKANVAWKVSAVGGGATAGGVTRALARAASSWTDCYRAGLRARATRVEGSATLRIACDEQGRVVEARLSGLDMPDVARCLERGATGATIPNADTGEAWSTLSLTFKLNE